MSLTLYAGDNRISLRRLIDQGVRVHAVVTDPPYALTSITKRFGKEGSAAARTEGNDGSFGRVSGGFMGMKWDATGIERDPEFWKLVYEILLPGGYAFAFSGARTGHWQACAMELAGFIMHPMHVWAYGSGFPKAHAADKAIDRLLGTKGTYGGIKAGYEGHYGTDNVRLLRESGTMSQANGFSRPWMYDPESVLRKQQKYKPGSPEAVRWEEWAYGTQTQKPAVEPIYLAQKPFSEKTGAANLLLHGVGAVNIGDCRVPIDTATDASQLRTMERSNRVSDDGWGMNRGAGESDVTVLDPTGRYPSNLILDGSPEVVALFPHTKSGKGAVKRASSKDRDGNTGTAFGAESRSEGTEMTSYGDEGSAARFFHRFPLTDEDYMWSIDAGIIGPDQGDAIVYHRKANKEDRAGSKHPTVKPVNLKKYLIRHITPPGGIVLDPFAGSGATAEAAKRAGFDCIIMEAEKNYVDFIHTRFNLTKNSTDEEIGIYSDVPTSGIRGSLGGHEHEKVANSIPLCHATGSPGSAALVYDLVDLLGDPPFEPRDTPRGYEIVEKDRSVSGTDLADLLC